MNLKRLIVVVGVASLGIALLVAALRYQPQVPPNPVAKAAGQSPQQAPLAAAASTTSEKPALSKAGSAEAPKAPVSAPLVVKAEDKSSPASAATGTEAEQIYSNIARSVENARARKGN